MLLALDTEVSGAQRNKGHPFDHRNKLCAVGMYNLNTKEYNDWKIEYDDDPYGDALSEIQTQVDRASVLIGFNLKFDLHWLRRYGISFDHCACYDLQLAYFILKAQKHAYPSLNEVLEAYGRPAKLDKVKEYWENGFDTTDIPYDILAEYLAHDVISTAALYPLIKKDIDDGGFANLHLLGCADLLTLQDMEYNGMLYDVDTSLQRGYELQREFDRITAELTELVNIPDVNWNSPVQISQILYGGDYSYTTKEQIGFFKTGMRAGQPKFKTVTHVIKLPRLVEPLKGSELADGKHYSTNEDTLRALRPNKKAKKVLDLVLEVSDLKKLIGTYYLGLPSKFEEFGWEGNRIHHSLNQCVAVTGRLSSTNPNLQNADKRIKDCFLSEYE